MKKNKMFSEYRKNYEKLKVNIWGKEKLNIHKSVFF